MFELSPKELLSVISALHGMSSGAVSASSTARKLSPEGEKFRAGRTAKLLSYLPALAGAAGAIKLTSSHVTPKILRLYRGSKIGKKGLIWKPPIEEGLFETLAILGSGALGGRAAGALTGAGTAYAYDRLRRKKQKKELEKLAMIWEAGKRMARKGL